MEDSNGKTVQSLQCRSRFLSKQDDVFQHNAWDNVEWNKEQEESAKEKVLENSEIIFSNSQLESFEKEAAHHWDKFYSIHQNRFFKDRHWLFVEFPELSGDVSVIEKEPSNDLCQAEEASDYTKESLISQNKSLNDAAKLLRAEEQFIGENSKKKILEVGCGVGNTVFPILETINDPNLFVYCCDFSSNAIDILKTNENYNPDRCQAFVFDLTTEECEPPFQLETLDIILCVFVLSALNPDKLEFAVKKLSSFLKPGGIILFRDYGRYDLAQLRFKKGRSLGDNFYARGDGTRCFFFTQEILKTLMESAGLEEVQNIVDRRLQVNRGKQIKMYRVWLQAKYRKPVET